MAAKVRDYAKLASDIKDAVGESNIISAAHCATRLRLVLKESPSAEVTKRVSEMPAVIQVVEKGGQYQIVIGTHAKDVYEELTKIMHIDESAQTEVKQGLFARIIATMSAVFAPFVYILAAAGLVQGCLIIITQFAPAFAETGTYSVLSFISWTPFTFLPVMIAVTASKHFKCNTYIAMGMLNMIKYPCCGLFYKKGVAIWQTGFHPLLDAAEMIVLASPIYYLGFSGQLQCVLNRIYALDKPRHLKRAALFLSSGDRDVYDGAIYAYRSSFLGYLELENMGIYTAFGDQNKSEELLNRLNAFGRSLIDIHEGGYSMSGHIAALSDSVTREKVVYKNRYGLNITGELYHAKDMDLTQKHSALIVGAPYGGVKEQGPCVYGNELVQRGFVVLTFDQSFMGESGGFPRNVSSPDIFTENFSAAVDFLGLQPFVDREKIGAIGICGSGGFALSAASMDSRIKAVIPVAMYDIAGNMNGISGEGRQGMIDMASQQRWTDLENGEAAYMKSYPDAPVETMPEGMEGTNAEFFSFYGMKRGWHPNALGNVTTASMADLMTFPTSGHIDTISPRPILFIVGENAHSRPFTDEAYAAAGEPKEIYVVPNANHVDLYDDVTKIPFDKIEEFLNGVFAE